VNKNSDRMMRIKPRIMSLIALFLSAWTFSGCFFGFSGSTGDAAAVFSISMKQPAAPVTSMVLVVTGPDMATITKTLSPDINSATLEVPAGTARTFTLLVNTVSATFKGETTVDLKPGETRTIALTPRVVATQLIIPDALNNRVVQISNIQGAGWKTRSWSDFGFSSPNEFLPVDIDVDSHGRIYIANYAYNGDNGFGLIRIDDMDSNYADISESNSIVVDSGVQAFAIDRERDYLYYNQGWDSLIHQVDLTQPLPLGPIKSWDLSTEIETFTGGLASFSTQGMAIGPDGHLYLADENDTLVVRFDPAGGGDTRVVAVFDTTIYEYEPPWDVMVRPPYVYASCPNRYAILQLDLDLKYIGSFGLEDDLSPPVFPGEFNVPKRFVAKLNNGFYVIDDGYNWLEGSPVDRLVGFNNMSGDNWTVFGTTGSGIYQFQFYESEPLF
jgi:hypothetical protein